MDALYIHTATKLAKFKNGDVGGSDSFIGKPRYIFTYVFVRALIAEFLATLLFVCIAIASTVDLPDDGASFIKVRIYISSRGDFELLVQLPDDGTSLLMYETSRTWFRTASPVMVLVGLFDDPISSFRTTAARGRPVSCRNDVNYIHGLTHQYIQQMHITYYY